MNILDLLQFSGKYQYQPHTENIFNTSNIQTCNSKKCMLPRWHKKASMAGFLGATARLSFERSVRECNVSSLLSFLKVFGHGRTDHRGLLPHLPRHGRHPDIQAAHRPQAGPEWPFPLLQLHSYSAPGGAVGGVSVERPSAAGKVPRTHLRTGTLVLLYITYQQEPLIYTSGFFGGYFNSLLNYS